MPFDGQYDSEFRQLARRLDGLDVDVYSQFGKDPLAPIIGLGDRDLRVGFFGRDPGREEVRLGEPFIGTGGQKVRQTLYQYLHGRPLPDFEASREVGRLFFWANTVPYKPTGNKAWSMAVKKRFQPLMARLLADEWRGEALITLGREAFLWFGIGQSREARQQLEVFWRRADRFESHIDVTVSADESGGRPVALYPLPHPSPLNATWYKHFPALLRARLEQLGVQSNNLRMGAQ